MNVTDPSANRTHSGRPRRSETGIWFVAEHLHFYHHLCIFGDSDRNGLESYNVAYDAANAAVTIAAQVPRMEKKGVDCLRLDRKLVDPDLTGRVPRQPLLSDKQVLKLSSDSPK